MATIEGVEIDLMPTKGMKEEAQRYRDWKADGEAGGTEVAARRATQILSGDELSADTVIAMNAWFARHEVDKQGEGFSQGEDGYPSPGRVAWAAWGGDAGMRWSAGKADRIKAIRDRSMDTNRAEPGELSVGDFVQWNSSGGQAKGKIDRIERDGSINVPDSEFTINGDEDDPAALITVYREGDEGWEETDVQVGHRFSALTKIPALRWLEGKTYKRSETTTFDEVEDRTYQFPFSSEFPVERYFGSEILSHDEGAADLDRLNDSAPLLFNHDPDRVIGVVERAYIDKKKRRGYTQVRFSRNEFAQEVLSDVKDGILRNVSFGYSIDKMEEREGGDFVATSWRPYEVSVVSIPADPGVGIGRSLVDSEPAKAAPAAPTQTVPEMENTAPDLQQVRAEAAEAERSRIAGISALCSKHNFEDLGRQLIESGRSIDEARAAVLEKLGAKPVETVKPVELEQRDHSNYQIADGLRAMLTGDWSSRGAGLVRELSQEVMRSSGVSASSERSFYVPFSALTRATYVTSGATTGGNLVQTDLLADDFIEALRNASPVMGLGVRSMTGLVGDVAIPRRSGVASTYYLSSETTAITQSESTFDQVTMSPKNLAALSKYSRQTLIQATPGIESLVRTDLTDGILASLDSAIINGSGSSGQPTGIRNVSGIGSVAMGTNGAALTMEKVVDLETEILQDNALVGNAMAYVTNAKVVAGLKKLRAGGSSSTDGSFLFNSDLQAIGRGPTPLTLNGYPIATTNAIPSNLTKGSGSNLSALVAGDFSQAMVGFYGNGLEIVVGEDSDDFAKALSSVRGIISFDVAVRHAQSFASIEDIVA
ncbi:MAG: putative major capsid protein [Prokaryotic dsDNA virus sp.]|jgi:HK97 family phage major capsid protein/HK97 family phage prohead protease|nr:MAG: putative major capsid protein [Prokaryotic dsDNA virus sp.]|tara:strand:- start:25441 stop:27915 length:2475 start_codon:yes stop_codon:yes gene_type:complete